MALVTGASWTFRVDDGDITEKTQVVGDIEDVGSDKTGVRAHRLTTTKPNGSVVSWQEDTGAGVIRHRELDMSGQNFTDEIYEPYKTRIDETAAHTVVGATWSEDLTEIVTDQNQVVSEAAKTETWVVEAVDEVVTVPAGDFCALRVKKTSSVGGTPTSIKTYWFARDVGKIKETGDSQTEELTDFSIP